MSSFVKSAVHPMKKNVYFITDNQEIKTTLMEMGIKEKQSQRHDMTIKEFIADWIRSTDKHNKTKNIRNLCRDSEMYEYLLDNLYPSSKQKLLHSNSHKYTTLFISGGDKIMGLVNFHIFTMMNGQKVLQTKGICIPDYGVKGSGSMLIDILKEVGLRLHVDKLAIFALTEAKGFYRKNGLVEEYEGTNHMVYNFTKPPEAMISTSYSPTSSARSRSSSARISTSSEHSSASANSWRSKTRKSRTSGKRSTRSKKP